MKIAMPSIPRRTVSLAVAAALALAASESFAQSPPPDLTIPNLTPVQAPTAQAITTLCPPIAPTANRNGTLTQRLAFSCTSIVVSGLGVQDPTFNLGISKQQVADALTQIAPVQHGAAKELSAETSRLNLVNARLLDLRAGRQGFSVSSNGVDVTRTASAKGKGGGAAADSPVGGPVGGFLNVAYNWGDADRTDIQEAYDYHNWSVVGGIDYRVSPSLVVGGAISYSDTRSTFEMSLGKIEARTTSVVGYGTYYVGEYYLDGYVSWGNVNYDSTRNIFIPSNNPNTAPITGSATSSPEGDEWAASFGIGRTFAFGGNTVSPVARLSYLSVRNKAFREDEPVAGLGLDVNERSVISLQSALGARFATAVSTSYGVFNPYLNAQWVHEFRNNTPSIISKYVADPLNTFFVIPTANPDRDYFVLTVGSTATLPNDVAAFVQVGGAVGLKDQSNYGVVLGLRKQF